MQDASFIRLFVYQDKFREYVSFFNILEQLYFQQISDNEIDPYPYKYGSG